MSIGKDITSSDNNQAFLDANDEIRGVETVCYGDCPSGTCIEDTITIHDITWEAPYTCVDGGVIRPKNTYTNLETSGFKTPVGYSGNFYGIRKYDGLIPYAPYNMIVQGQTGSNISIKVPTEFNEVEYGINNYVGYSGVKLTAPYSYRSSGDRYGKSLAIKNNVLAIGAPMTTIPYTEYDSSGNLATYNLEKAGTVYIYNREDRPSGTWPIDKDSSPWILDTVLTLPSSILKDFYTETTTSNIDGVSLPLPVTERLWDVGQEGREFGHSVGLSLANSGNRNILVVGAPSAQWNYRTFEELQSSGVQICLMIFTDEFEPVYYLRDSLGNVIFDQNRKPIEKKEEEVRNTIKNKDLIFQYFSDPPVKFDVKLVVCEPLADYSSKIPVEFGEPKPEYIFRNTISRNQGLVNSTQTEKILSGIKETFHKAFPYDPTKLNNNIPPLVGFYVDESASLGKESLNPALDQFFNYYREYSFASGLTDFYNQRCSGDVVEYTPQSNEGWIDVTSSAINHLLDTGRLLQDNQVRFFTSGVGEEAFNNNLSRFNYPPSSGGRVFIFEQESGSWNLIQTIKANSSPNSFDRFGHSVNISENGEIVVIGSPYTNETCKAFEYNSSEKQRLLSQISSWLGYKSSITGGNNIRYTTLIDNYQSWLSSQGFAYANKALYDNLTPSEKVEARSYLNIQEYQNIFSFDGVTGDINYGKELTWNIIINKYAASPRLGYSTAVNEDGDIIAFGAPTDGFNKFDDARIYYKNLGYDNPQSQELNSTFISPSWASDVNAGAVRVFESRKYYPHSKVIEYGKFGNLQQSLSDPLDSGHFNYLSTIFADKNFEITPFAETDIPQEAGLVFIITPEIDAASEEIIDKIIDWLSLGDRNLVLVGNDPTWENDGAYASSNNIINKILDQLDSRMKLYPARNYIEACVSGCGTAIASFRPENGTQSYVQPLDMSIYGVADIRTNFDNLPIWSQLNALMPCQNNAIDFITGEPLPPANTRCELPLRNVGDLRAEWKASCQDCELKTRTYSVNLPYLFGNFQPPCCDIQNAELIDMVLEAPNQEPVPLLAAATNVTETVVIPATPATSGFRPIYSTETINKFTTRTFIDTGASISGYTFIWNASGNNTSSINYNTFSTISSGLFYQPTIFEERQSLLQANAIPAQEIVARKIVTDINANLVAQDNYNDTSKIITIGSLDLESVDFLYFGDDQNINFYVNLVSKPNQRGGSRIAQLGSWTGRRSFADAKTSSILYEIFNNTNNEVRLNVNKISILDDICWIANPLNLPSTEELQELKNWLNFPNRRLIITYDNSQTQARLIKQLLEMLGSKLYPLYSPSTANFKEILASESLPINPLHFASRGSLQKYNITQFKLPSSIDFIPMDNIENTIPIISVPTQIFDTVYDTVGYWGADTGFAKVSFPSIAGSGYKIFISSISESPNENIPINVYISNVSRQFDLPYPKVDSLTSYKDITKIGLYDTIDNNIQNKIVTRTYDIQSIENSNNIDIYFNNDNPRLSTNTTAYIPKTTRIIGVSGILLPVVTSKTTETITNQKFERYEQYQISPAKPEQTIVTQRFTYFTNLNDQYCASEDCLENGFGNQYIADGPVVAAQEVEHISSFNAGVARSRITLLSDSALVQGRCLGDEDFRASSNAVAFIRSLYPETSFPSENYGRQYNITEKIVAPDRGSPQKYYSLIANSGINFLFAGSGKPIEQKFLSAFTTSNSNYDPKFVLDPDPVYYPDDPEEIKKEKIDEELSKFDNAQWKFGGSAKFSGVIEGKLYADAGIEGGMPQIMKDTGYDYLDFDRFPSGYPGDLFGYSISLSKDKLIIGAPFAAFSQENPTTWSYFFNGNNAINSGLKLGFNGGAGAVYVYERNFNGSGLHGTKSRWEMTQKIRPQNINIGQDLNNSGLAISSIGNHGYSNDYLTKHSIVGDKFGSSVDISSDILVIGAPGHDFSNLVINGTGEFIRKCFNGEFHIPDRSVYDLGLSGYRVEFPNSGSPILNNGAIFAFENSIVDWATKTQKWTLIEKIIPQGSGSRINGTENDAFGNITKIHRSLRSDADYTIVGGATNHTYDGSGYNSADRAGASYIYDVMLREQPPSISSPLSYIDARIFGERDNNRQPEIRILVQNSGQNNVNYYSSGIIYADSKGQIFVEASGQDPINKGFIIHRPYIVSIDGKYAYGTPNSGQLSLFIDGKGGDVSGNMNLFNKVDNSAIVYNSIGLYNGAIIDFATNSPSGLYLYIDCPEPISISESGLCLYTASGIGNNTDALNLRIRGK